MCGVPKFKLNTPKGENNLKLFEILVTFISKSIRSNCRAQALAGLWRHLRGSCWLQELGTRLVSC